MSANVDLHVVPALGRIGMRRLRHHHIEAVYDQLLTPNSEPPALAPKTDYEIHLVIRGALDVAVRCGLVTRNVALVARSPRLRAIQRPRPSRGRPSNCRRFCGPRSDIACSRCCGWQR